MFGLDLWPHRDHRDNDDEDEDSFFVLYRSYIKGFLILITGWGVFVCTEYLADQTTDWFQGRRVRIESLLVCMIGACYVSHFSDSAVRALFARILHKCGRYVFLPFFTLTGASLNIPSVLSGWAAAVILCSVRLISIAFGSVLAAYMDGRQRSTAGLQAPLVVSTRRSQNFEGKEEDDDVEDRMASKAISDETSEQEAIQMYLWCTLLAQAGVAMGLAIEVQGDFHWGDKFSNVVLSVIVLNQIIGPILCKFGLQRMMHAKTEKDEIQTVHENDNLRKLSQSDKRWSCPPETSLSSFIQSSNSPASPTTLKRKILIKHVPSGSAYSSLLTPKHRNRKRSSMKNRSQSMLDPETPSVLSDEF